MRQIFTLFCGGFALCAQAFVLDFPGDEPVVEPKFELIDISQNAPTAAPAAAPAAAPSAAILPASGATQPAQNAQNAQPNGELDPQLVVLLSMLPPQKLYALKLALDRMFASPASEPKESEPSQPPQKRELLIRVSGQNGSQTYREELKSPRKNKINIDIN